MLDLTHGKVHLYITVSLKADSHIACRAHAVPVPCRAAKGLDCAFAIWFIQCGRVWFTRAMPMPWSYHAVLLKATTQHVLREAACGLPARVRLLPATMRSSTKVVIRSVPISDAGGQCETKLRLSWTRKRMVAAHYKKDYLLNCWSSSSDISGYHEDFHEWHGTIGTWHVWIKGTAWQGNGMGTACYVWIGLYCPVCLYYHSLILVAIPLSRLCEK
jgi:hypothetical protein